MKLSPEAVVKKLEKMKSVRQLWENHWQELADFVAPRKNTINVMKSPGEKRNTHLFDSSGQQSAETLAGALQGLLTNPTAQWFELTTGSNFLDEGDEVRLWLQEAARRITGVLNNTNFQDQIHELYMDIVTFGTAAMSIEEDPEKIIRFSTYHIAEWYVEENNKGIVDTIFREFEWNAANIIREFGEDNVPEIIRKSFKDDDNRKFKVIHAIYPDLEDIKPDKLFPFISQHVLVEKRVELKSKGFREFPFVVPRWTKASGETYGRSPAMTALPDVKMINKMQETVLRGAQKTIDPPLQAPDDGFVIPLVTRPGGVNYFRAGSPDRIVPIFNDARIDFGFQATEKIKQQIREAFFIDQLQLNSIGPQMTATEVLQRTEEKMRLLAPVLGRQQNELLRPMIDRIFSIMIKRKLLPEAPESLQDTDLDVQYSSLIAKAQRVNEAQNILRSMEMATPFLQIDPASADLIDAEQALRVIARLHSLDQSIIRDDKDVAQIRQAREQEKQQALQMQQQQLQSEQIKNVTPALSAAIG